MKRKTDNATMVSRNVLISRLKIGYLLMVLCVVLFNACNTTPCDRFVGYAPRFYAALDKFVWTACDDPNITISACDFKDVDKSRYIVAQYIPERNTYKLIRGAYPGFETQQYVEQAGGDYWFVNVDDFARQATSAANDGEWNYSGAAHRFAGTAIMIDYRYAAAKADALAHFPCGGGVANFDCMSDDFKLRLGDCFYSEDEPEETGYVPYFIDRTACTAGDNFRVAVANTIVIEDCDPPYHIDTKWLKDQITPTAGDRILYIGVNIDPFNPAKRYALYIEDGLKVIYKGELGYFNGNAHIAEVDPQKAPKKAGPVSFTVRAYVYMNDAQLGNSLQKTYNVSVKEFVDNINTPSGPVTNISPVQLELKNRYPYPDPTLHPNISWPYKERVMNIQFLGNSGTTFNSNISSRGFHTTFTKVWTTSEIHAIPNYLPSTYEPSVSASGVPNDVPGNTVLPEYVVDQDGYGVILDTDFSLSGNADPKKSYEELISWFERRLEAYMSNVNAGRANMVNTLRNLNFNKDLGLAGQPTYQNRVSIVGIQGYRIYQVDPATEELKRRANGTLVPDVTASIPLPGAPPPPPPTPPPPAHPTFAAYRASLRTGTAGVTFAITENEAYHPVVIIDIGMMTQLGGTANLNQRIMATAMHELAHAWFNKKVTDDTELDGTDVGIAKSHAGFVKGDGSPYCLMLYCPKGQEAAFVAGTLSSTVAQQFSTGQLTQMAFSRSIQQRLANVMAMTYDN